MKKVYLILCILFCTKAFCQEYNNSVFVFEFNNKIDEIVYRKTNTKKEISGFNLMINKKKVFFSAVLYPQKIKKNINTSRSDLDKIVEKDNFNKKYLYIIFLKKENKYYSIDHIVRKVESE